MDTKHLDELRRIEDTYWWHVAKRRLVTQLLAEHFPPPGRLIEGGIGAGGNLRFFQEIGYDVTGFDVAKEAIDYAHERRLQNVVQLDLMDPWPVKPASAKVILLLDVLEHIKNPVHVLRNARRALYPGGGIIATVPAFPSLFCGWDRMLGHYRRYTRQTLREHAEAASLTVSWLSSWNVISLPVAFATRGIGKIFHLEKTREFPYVTPAINSLLLNYTDIEHQLQRRMTLPIGLSLVAILKSRGLSKTS